MRTRFLGLVKFWVSLLFLALVSTPIALSQSTSSQAADSLVDCHLRIVWGSAQPNSFQGEIALTQGSLDFQRSLSLQADSIGKIAASNPQTLQVRAHSPSTFGGADVRIRTHEDAELSIALTAKNTSAASVERIRVSELLHEQWRGSLAGFQVAIERLPQDRFRFVTEQHKNGIVPIGEPWPATITGYRTQFQPGDYYLIGQIRASGGSLDRILEEPIVVDQFGNFPPVEFVVPVPEREGVYQLEFRIQKRRFLERVVSSNSDVIRRFEFVAMNPSQNFDVIDRWITQVHVNAYRASVPGSLAWLSPIAVPPDSSGQVAFASAFTTGLGLPETWQQWIPLSSSLETPLVGGQLGWRLVRTQQQAISERCLVLNHNAWLACPIGNLRPGTPYRLRVRVPDDAPNNIVVSIRNVENSVVVPLGNDYRILRNDREITRSQSDQVEGEQSTQLVSRDDGGQSNVAPSLHTGETVGLREYEFLFWPSSKQVNILLANGAKHEQLAHVLDFSIDRAVLSNAERIASEEDWGAIPDPSRLLGIHLDKPLLSAFFGPEKDLDPTTRRPYDSWRTWNTACSRLMQYLEWIHANLIVLKIQADGGAVFPSRVLEPNSQYDSGIFFSDGRTPDTKDGTALLLEHCHRHRIRVVLSLDLDSALPALERLPPSEREAIYQANLNGHRDSRRYNPLHPTFQSEVQRLVDEILTRYGAHPSFAGIQFQLHRQSQLLFRGDRWGWDRPWVANDETFSPSGPAPDRRGLTERELELPFGKERIAQRAEELSRFWIRLGKTIRTQAPQAALFLDAGRLWESAPTEADFLSPLGLVRNPHGFMQACGVDAALLRDSPDVTLQRGQFLSGAPTVDPEAWIRQIAQEQGLTSRSDSLSIVQQPAAFRIAGLPDGQATTLKQPWQATMYPLDIDSSKSIRRKLLEELVHHPLRLAVVGAWVPRADQTEDIREIFSVLHQLPTMQRSVNAVASSNDSTSTNSRNLIVRDGIQSGLRYVQIANSAPWEETVELHLQSTTAAPDESPRIQILSGADQAADPGSREQRELRIEDGTTQQHSREGRSRLYRATVRLRPYDLVGLSIEDPAWELVGYSHATSTSVSEGLSRELASLEAVIAESADPTQLPTWADVQGGFESWESVNKPVAWNVSALPGVEFERASELPHSGNASLRIVNRLDNGDAAWIQSRPFEVPATGRLTIQAWLRTPTDDPTAVARVALIGHSANGARYERSITVGSRNDRNRQIANDWGTQPATLDVNDIPLDQISQIFVRIELAGRGTLWVDDVQVLQSWLHPQERNFLQGRMLVAKEKLAQGDLLEAEQLLDSPWGRYLSEHHPALSAPNLKSKVYFADDESSSETTASENNGILKQMRDAMRGAVRERWKRIR